jgi:hypothetical protein
MRVPATKDAARAACGAGTREETAAAAGRFFPARCELSGSGPRTLLLPTMTPRRRWTAALVATFATATLAATGDARDLVLSATGEAALVQPMVVLSLGDEKPAPRKRSGDDLSDLLEGMPAVAILDTGASGHILSAATAARFGIEVERGARYVEAGMSGDHVLGVSRPIALGVSGVEPEAADDDARPRRGPEPAPFRLAAQRFLLNDAPSDPAAALLSPGSMVDVVGMPLIRERVIEIEPTSGPPGALALRLHPSAAGLRTDAWIALTLVDYNRRDPRNRGPLPSLATNPLVPDVTITLGTTDVEGDWLLDTGAACSMISTKAARRLGLVDAAGTPTRAPDFTLPVGGVGGGHHNLPGFRLDQLTLETADGRTLVFPDPAVIIHDVSTKNDDGDTITLDGILGMNLLLPSGSGVTMLGASKQLPGPFERVVIDVAGKRLGLRLR